MVRESLAVHFGSETDRVLLGIGSGSFAFLEAEHRGASGERLESGGFPVMYHSADTMTLCNRYSRIRVP